MESKVRMFLQTGKMVNLRIVILPISDLAKLPLSYYLDKMHYNVEDAINIQILLSENAGEVFKDDGIRYYMHSKC